MAFLYPPFKSRGSSGAVRGRPAYPLPLSPQLCNLQQFLNNQHSSLFFSISSSSNQPGSQSGEPEAEVLGPPDGDLRVLVEAAGAGAGLRRDCRVRDGRAGRRRRGGGRRRRGAGGRQEGCVALLPEGQEGAQPGRRDPLPGIRHGGRRVLRCVRRARAVRAVREQAGARLPPLQDPEPPERAAPGRRGRRRRPGVQRRVAVVVVDGRQRPVVAAAVSRADAGGVAGGVRQGVRGHGLGAQGAGQRQRGLQLQRHHRRVRHQAGEGPDHREPRRLEGGAGDGIGDGVPQGRAAHHRPEAQRARGGGADQAVQRARVRAQGRAVGATCVAARRGLPGPGHGAVAGRLPSEAPRRGVGAAGEPPPHRRRRPVPDPGDGRRVGRAEQRGGGVHRVRHPAEAARVQGRRRGRRAALAEPVPVLSRRRLLRRLPLPPRPGLGRRRRVPALASSRKRGASLVARTYPSVRALCRVFVRLCRDCEIRTRAGMLMLSSAVT